MIWHAFLQSNLFFKLTNKICLPLQFPFKFANPIHLLFKLLFKSRHYFFLKLWKHLPPQRLICCQRFNQIWETFMNFFWDSHVFSLWMNGLLPCGNHVIMLLKVLLNFRIINIQYMIPKPPYFYINTIFYTQLLHSLNTIISFHIFVIFLVHYFIT